MSEVITGEQNVKENITNGSIETDLIITTSGDGVSTAIAGHPTIFVVNTSDCKEHVNCGLHVVFDGPEKPQIEFDQLNDGNIRVTYLPSVAGEYTLTVKYNNRHVRGSPFHTNVICHGVPFIKPHVTKRNIVRKIKLTGLQAVPVNQVAEMYLDISHAEMNLEGDLMVDINGPMVPQYSTVEDSKGIVTLTYTPIAKGEYTFTLRFHGEHIPGSPYIVVAE